jgi:GAF domain-containing protein
MGSAFGPRMFRPSLSSVDTFQAVLLEVSSAASKGLEFEEMMGLFCRVARDHFEVSSVCCWLLQGRELVGSAGCGTFLEDHRGRRISVDGDTYSGRAVRDNVIVVVNDVPAQPDEIARKVPVASILVTPLTVSGRVIGAIVFAHNTRKNFFTEDLSAKGQIIASLLGSLVEIKRLTRASQEERRRAEALMRCAQALHARLEIGAVCDELTHSVCDLLQALATVMLVQNGERFEILRTAQSSTRYWTTISREFARRRPRWRGGRLRPGNQ